MSRDERSSDLPAEAEDGTRAWLAAVERSYRPTPLDAAGRTRFDARLHERILEQAASPGRRGGRRPWARVLIPVSMVCALVALYLGSAGPASTPPEVPIAEVEAWEWDLLLGAAWPGEASESSEDLPDEYVALASAFLE